MSDAVFRVSMTSVARIVFLFGPFPFLWQTKKQAVISTSTCAADEYLGMFAMSKEFTFLRAFMVVLFLYDMATQSEIPVSD